MYTYYDNHNSKDFCVWRCADNSICNKRSQQESQERLGIGSDVELLLLFSRSVISNSATPWTAALQAPFPVLHHLPEFAETHIYWVSDAIQPSHPLLSPSPSAFNLSQHQGLLFQWVSSSQQVTKLLELQFQHQSFLWIFIVYFL